MLTANYYLAQDVRELDRLAIEEHGIPGFTLMQRAGQAAFQATMQKWPDTTALCCFCGGGNNGGDGYVIAALAAATGLKATVVTVGDPDKLGGDAKQALKQAEQENVSFISFETFYTDPPELTDTTVLIDAMLGTGLSGEVKGKTLEAIEWINASPCPVLSVDIPSGLCSDTGKILGHAVKADLTVTFIGRKLGQVIGQGPTWCGELVFDDLGVPGEIFEQVSPVTPKSLDQS